MDPILFVKDMIAGAITGAGLALLGYGKTTDPDTFDYKKATETVFVGAVVGGIGAFMGMDYVTATDYVVNIGANTLIQYAWKTIKRKLLKW